MQEEMFIGSLTEDDAWLKQMATNEEYGCVSAGGIHARIRAETRARRRLPRRNLKTLEYRALDQIVAEAEAAGNVPVVVGPSGILEIRDSGVTVRRGPIDNEPASLG